MARKRRPRVRYHSVRGGHYGHFGPRYLGYHMAVRTGRRRRPRTRRNPFYRHNPGGTNWLLIGGLAVGAFFLMRGGAGALFGGAPAGYTQLGTSGYYRGPDGRLYQRSATGQMMLSPTQAPAGSTMEQQLIAAGSKLALPLIGSAVGGLTQWIGSLFTTGSATAPAPGGPAEAGGGVMPSEGAIFGSELPALEPIGGGMTADWWAAPDSGSWFSQEPVAYDLGSTSLNTDWLAQYDTPQWSTSLSLAPIEPLPTFDYGYMGLGRVGRHAYGQLRHGPSGELEARFLRRPPSYR